MNLADDIEDLDSSSEEETKKEEVKETVPASSYDKKETSDAFDDLFNN